MNEIMVSVCILSYNHEKYLRNCLEGVVKQQTSFPIEVLVHDDASTDSSPVIIKDYQHRYPNIIKPILQVENQYSKQEGSILSRFVFPLCLGKYIALCEGDDYWTDPLKLQKQVDFMENHLDCTCYAHNSLMLNTKTHEIELFNDKLLCMHDYTLEQFITRDWFTPTQSLLYRRDAYNTFADIPGFMHGDYSILLNILLREGSYLHYENEIMSVYRNGGWASTHFKEQDLYYDFISLLSYYKEKSNHRCDEIFDQQIDRQKQGLKQLDIYQKALRRSRSLHVRIWHYLSRFCARIANIYGHYVYVEKRVCAPQNPNIEPLI